MKTAIDDVAPRLANLCRSIWNTVTVPKDWKGGVISSFYKNKGDRRQPSSYRPITLLSIPSKIVTSIILRRIHGHLLQHRRPHQGGFTPKRSTADCILALSTLAQTRREYRQVVNVAYVDLKAAFDSLDRSALWLLLQGIGVPAKYISLLQALYSNTTCKVRADGLISNPFPTTAGVRQGCVAAPNLFIVAIDYWLRSTSSRAPNFGVSYHHNITDLYYADDIVIFADHSDTLVKVLETLSSEATPLGLTINWTKRKSSPCRTLIHLSLHRCQYTMKA